MARLELGQKEGSLENKIEMYYGTKSQMDILKKEVDSLNKSIKEEMRENNIEELEVGDIVAKYSSYFKEDIDEDKLIEILKPMKLRGIIKKKEYVDLDALEAAIYHGKVNAADLDPSRIKKEVETLRITRRRPDKNE